MFASCLKEGLSYSQIRWQEHREAAEHITHHFSHLGHLQSSNLKAQEPTTLLPGKSRGFPRQSLYTWRSHQGRVVRLLHPGSGEATQGLVKAQLAPPVPLPLLAFGYVWEAVFNLSTSDTANLCLKQLWLCPGEISPGAQLSQQAPLCDRSCTILQLVSHYSFGSQSQHGLPDHILCTLFSLRELKIYSIWNSV